MTDNSGLNVGLGVTALGVANAYTMKPMAKKIYKVCIDNLRKNMPAADAYEAAKPIFEAKKAMKNINLFKSLLPVIPLYLGCGAIVDWANNKQRANSEPNAETEKGNKYTKVNMGKKLGAILGAVTCGISSIINNKAIKQILATSPNKAFTIGFAFVTSALGGLMLGSIADKMSNKQAAKEADKMA